MLTQTIWDLSGRRSMPCAKRIILLTATIGLGLASLAAAQQEGAKGVVAIRQATMDANAKHMNAIKAILTEDPQLIKLVAFHAEAIAEAAEYVPEMFPDGSTDKPTAALPVIWEKPDQFKQVAERAHVLAGKLAETSQGGDVQATLAAFAALGKEGCGGCHETFRKKQD
jgi:cytochrome c556